VTFRAFRRASLVLPIPIAVLISGCSVINGDHTNLTAPSAATVALSGSWESIQSVPSATCSSFTWVVTQESGDTATGDFSAMCFGSIPVTGSAHGTISGDSLTWTAVAAAAQTSCGVTLSGTARIDQNRLQIPYAGTTCLGDVTGTEVLQHTDTTAVPH